MPRPSKVPNYTHHKASGQAVVRIQDKDHYLGLYGSDASHEAYQRLIAQWRAGQQTQPPRPASTPISSQAVTVNEVLLAYFKFAEGYYVKNGKTTPELAEMKFALRPVRKLYGRQPMSEFGPTALKTVRQHMIDAQGLCRNVVNHRCDRIKRFVRWAVSEELAPPYLYEALRTVQGLRFGRTKARETEPIKPVPWAWVEPLLPAVAGEVAAMIQLQWLTGMRPCEAVIMRACDIDMSAEVWLYEPADHKNRWRGHRRIVALGPKAQEVVKPFLKLATEAYLFSPQEAEARRNDQRRQERKTPMTPSQRARRPKKAPGRTKRDRYDVASYRRAITYGIKKLNKNRPADQQIPPWFPLQLRHSRATEVRKQFGLEAAQVALGHAHANTTEIYAERNLEAAVRVARAMG
jgi:integrase